MRDSEDCRVIHGRRPAASTPVERSDNSLADIMGQLKTALATDYTVRSARASPRFHRNHCNPGVAGGDQDGELPVCAYREKPGHNEWLCLSNKMPPYFKASTRALQHLYEQNLEQFQCEQQEQQQQAKPIPAAAVQPSPISRSL